MPQLARSMQVERKSSASFRNYISQIAIMNTKIRKIESTRLSGSLIRNFTIADIPRDETWKPSRSIAAEKRTKSSFIGLTTFRFRRLSIAAWVV
jgi:hypothetical protein